MEASFNCIPEFYNTEWKNTQEKCSKVVQYIEIEPCKHFTFGRVDVIVDKDVQMIL